jgi:hypothetical protein
MRTWRLLLSVVLCCVMTFVVVGCGGDDGGGGGGGDPRCTEACQMLWDGDCDIDSVEGCANDCSGYSEGVRDCGYETCMDAASCGEAFTCLTACGFDMT